MSNAPAFEPNDKLHEEMHAQIKKIHSTNCDYVNADVLHQYIDELYLAANQEVAQRGLVAECFTVLNRDGGTSFDSLPAAVNDLMKRLSDSEQRLKSAQEQEPAALVDEGDDGMFIEFIYGEDGNPLRLGDKLYAAPVPADHIADERKMVTDPIIEVLRQAIMVVAYRDGDVSTEDGDRATTNTDSIIRLESALCEALGTKYDDIDLSEALELLGKLSLSTAPRITEQDAREIISSYALWRGTEYNSFMADKFAGSFTVSNAGRALLDRLNIGRSDHIPDTGKMVVNSHQDDIAVDDFANAMKEKLAKSRAKGRGGWDDPERCKVEHLAKLLGSHLEKTNAGNFIDVANFCMMLNHRKASPMLLAEAIKGSRFTADEKAAIQSAMQSAATGKMACSTPYKTMTRAELSSGLNRIHLLSEAAKRADYFFRQIDGSYQFPSPDGQVSQVIEMLLSAEIANDSSDHIAEAGKMIGTWNSIDSAPKDGTEILLCSEVIEDIGLCYWSENLGGWTWGAGNLFKRPAFWMHLPETPSNISDHSVDTNKMADGASQ